MCIRNNHRNKQAKKLLQRLTGGWLVAVMSMSEVLRILYDGNTSHPYDNRIRTRVQSTGGNNPMVDMMERAGRVFLTTDHSDWTWNETEGRGVMKQSKHGYLTFL